MLSQICIILVDTETADNIGAAARAMKNMGFSDLRLVRPPRNWKIKGKKLAMSAGDVLHSAKVFPSVSKAGADLHCLIGTSRRIGQHRGRFLSFEKTLSEISKRMRRKQNIGILFGRESKGLDNESLEACDWAVTIPAHKDYPSLNLAQAVMVTLFSLFIKTNRHIAKMGIPPLHEALIVASKNEIHDTLRYWEKALRRLNYGGNRQDLLERILATFEGIFKRNGMLISEAQMIKGLSRRICQKTSCKS